MTTERASTWSLTINNPTSDDEECMNIARSKGWRLDGQLEVGKEGTPHYQIMLKTPQVRFSAIKKVFPRAHIEIARNSQALANYVNKEETRVADLPGDNNKYPSTSRFFDLVWDVIEEFPNGEHFRDLCPRTGNFPKSIRDDVLFAATRILIERGYHVETMAVNNLILNSWRWFHRSLRLRRQADRQTQDASETVSIVSVPTINADSPSSRRGSQVLSDADI